MHVRSKDMVLVLSGKDRGRRGSVLSVDPGSSRALVEGVNIQKKHVRADPRKGIKGGILEREAPVHVSNLMVVCPRCGNPTRVGHETLASGKKARRCSRKDCGQQMDA
jgi:large subunit ribosomal protein L24